MANLDCASSSPCWHIDSETNPIVKCRITASLGSIDRVVGSSATDAGVETFRFGFHTVSIESVKVHDSKSANLKGSF
ncbi:uncharacterized protein RAG0_11827 [Rhynchosporium agropyri]|uniref:Uncharacterized protein n=1 Tax=Rhynchosporium agropyri TaxID=914238 RepID=A0A1E1L8F4_9HELO|nr:uncharacterized protein RAG0_11827 [Rhynchosporium agropyri]